MYCVKLLKTISTRKHRDIDHRLFVIIAHTSISMIGKISDCSVILSKNAESSKRVKSQNQAPMDHRSFNSFIIM